MAFQAFPHTHYTLTLHSSVNRLFYRLAKYCSSCLVILDVHSPVRRLYLCNSWGTDSHSTSVPREVSLVLPLFSGVPFLLPLFLKGVSLLVHVPCDVPLHMTLFPSGVSLLQCLSYLSSQRAILSSDYCFLVVCLSSSSVS
jgi:hypothetical protein